MHYIGMLAFRMPVTSLLAAVFAHGSGASAIKPVKPPQSPKTTKAPINTDDLNVKTWHSYPTQPAKLEVDPNPPSPAQAGPLLLTINH
jgi:hypothetical protein